MATAFVVTKRRNPFGEGRDVAPKGNRADMLSPYERTVQMMMASAAHGAAFRSPTSPSQASSSSSSQSVSQLDKRRHTGPCEYCRRSSQDLIDCSHCGKGSCDLCLRQCDKCLDVFCSICSVTNYDAREDRVFCIDCEREERVSRSAAASSSSSSSVPSLPSPASSPHPFLQQQQIQFQQIPQPVQLSSPPFSPQPHPQQQFSFAPQSPTRFIVQPSPIPSSPPYFGSPSYSGHQQYPPMSPTFAFQQPQQPFGSIAPPSSNTFMSDATPTSASSISAAVGLAALSSPSKHHAPLAGDMADDDAAMGF